MKFFNRFWFVMICCWQVLKLGIRNRKTIYLKDVKPFHFGRLPCKSEKNVAIALRNYYIAMVQYADAQRRHASNSDEIDQAYKKFRQAKEDLGQEYAYQLGDEFAVEYRIWAHHCCNGDDKYMDTLMPHTKNIAGWGIEMNQPQVITNHKLVSEFNSRHMKSSTTVHPNGVKETVITLSPEMEKKLTLKGPLPRGK